MRRHNMSLVLREVHRDGSVTRAELTRRLGLSRSTIGALVADLAALQVLQAIVPSGGTRAGRPSHVVEPHDKGPYVVAVDVDVSRVVMAAIGIGGSALVRHEIPVDAEHAPLTPDRVSQLIAEVVPTLQTMVGRSVGPEAIGVSVPGMVDRSTGIIRVAPNLEWRDVSLTAELDDACGAPIPILVGNDADLSVLTEHSRGVARTSQNVVYLMGRFGVGAGIIVNGAPLNGHNGHAGEIGHNVVDPSGPECHCGKRGCLETYIGAAALLAHAGRSGPVTVEKVQALVDDARDGQPQASAAVRAVADSLGRGLATLVNILNPQMIVLGGFLSDVLTLARADLEASLGRHTLEPPFETVALVHPQFGGDSALLGAAEIAFAATLDDPAAGRQFARR